MKALFFIMVTIFNISDLAFAVSNDENAISYTSEILDVPFYRQENDVWCGQASAQMILSYYGVNMSQEEIAWHTGYSRTNWGHWSWFYRWMDLGYIIVKDYAELEGYVGLYPIMFLDLEKKHWTVISGKIKVGDETIWIVNDPYISILLKLSPEVDFIAIVVVGEQ